MVGGHTRFSRIVHPGVRASAQLAFMGDQQVEDREERLTRPSVAPVRAGARNRPKTWPGFSRFVIFLVVVARVVARFAQQLRIHAHVRRKGCEAAHVFGAGGGRVTPEMIVVRAGAHTRSVRPCPRIDLAACGQPVQIRSGRIGVAVAAQFRAGVSQVIQRMLGRGGAAARSTGGRRRHPQFPGASGAERDRPGINRDHTPAGGSVVPDLLVPACHGGREFIHDLGVFAAQVAALAGVFLEIGEEHGVPRPGAAFCLPECRRG